MNSSLTLLCEVIPPFDDTSPPIISWLRHHRDSTTDDESKFGKDGFDKTGKSKGYRVVDEHNNPKFDELQKCAINGICEDRLALEDPLQYTLRNITRNDEGWYSCLAKNNFGVTLSSGYIKVIATLPTTSSKIVKAQSPHLYVFVGGGTVFIMSTIAVFMYCIRHRKRQRLQREDLKIAQNINPVTKWVRIGKPVTPETDASFPIQWPDIKIDKVDADSFKGNNGIQSFGEYGFDPDIEWEIDRSRLKFGELVGEGEFGRVACAVLDNKTKVAVKMLKEGHTDSDLVSLVQEMVVMKQMKHDQPNIIKLVGACTQPVGYPLFVVVEFAEFGNLKEYLISKKPLPRPPRSVMQSQENGIEKGNGYEVPIANTDCFSHPSYNHEQEVIVNKKELHNIAWQVSKGMSYLAQRKFVHRDLAARNILVCANNVYKIADFGMARPIRHKDYYRRTSSGKVPLKWMAPESILEGVHTTQSDVWSYGILLWEIFSYGESPLGVVQHLGSDIFLEYLKQRISLIKHAKQYMMERPINMTDEIHNLMAQCWNFDPGLRPNWPKIEDNTRNYYQYYQPREYLAMASKSTPIVKKGSLTHCGRNRMDSTSSRLTNSSISSNGTQQNPTTYLGESAPLIRCSTGYVF